MTKLTAADKKYLQGVKAGIIAVCGEGTDNTERRAQLVKRGLVRLERLSPRDTGISLTPAGLAALAT